MASSFFCCRRLHAGIGYLLPLVLVVFIVLFFNIYIFLAVRSGGAESNHGLPSGQVRGGRGRPQGCLERALPAASAEPRGTGSYGVLVGAILVLLLPFAAASWVTVAAVAITSAAFATAAATPTLATWPPSCCCYRYHLNSNNWPPLLSLLLLLSLFSMVMNYRRGVTPLAAGGTPKSAPGGRFGCRS